MDNYIAVVFNNDQQAADGLHQLWNLDALGQITVHGAAVLHRDDLGYIHVASKQTNPGVRTAVGVGLGALLGALAGPIGVAAGAAAAAAGTGAAIGAAAGGIVGLTADGVKSGEHEEAAFQSGLVIHNNQSAVIAEVSEDWTETIDEAMKRLGGKVYRRPKGTVLNDSFTDDYYADYLYPYDYVPYYYN